MSSSLWRTLIDQVLRAPAWREKLGHAGFTPLDLRDPSDIPTLLQGLPELSRAELAHDLPEWLALPDEARTQIQWTWSSGSSGSQPLLVPRTATDTRWRWQLQQRAFEARGGDVAALRSGAFLCALPGRPEYRTHADSESQIPIERLSLEGPQWTERLARIAPDFWNLSPVGLEVALREIRAARIPRPRVVFSTALHLPLALKREAEQELHCPVIDFYSTAETGPIAAGCPESDTCFHLFSPELHVQRDAKGLRVTRLSESLLPLLNYRIHDTVESVSEECPACGRHEKTLVGFRGRTLSEKGEHHSRVQRGLAPA